MNRRGFLALLAGAVLDPERLLWVPGRKVISIPAKLPPLTVHLYMDLTDWQRCFLDHVLKGNVKIAIYPRRNGKTALLREWIRSHPDAITLPPITRLDGRALSSREEAGSGEETVGFVS